MEGYGLLLEVMTSLSRIIPMSLFFFETWLPLFSLCFFFGPCFFSRPSFFWGNHNLILFQGCSTREITKTWSIYYVEWVNGGANSQCRNVASWMGRVCAYDRESMKSISLGSHNLTKLNRTSSSIV